MPVAYEDEGSRYSLSCFFRTPIEKPFRKALIQITECCNLACKHCFISAKKSGYSIPIGLFGERIIPQLRQCRVSKVTLTGGEPFLHPQIVDIVDLFNSNGFKIGICSNGSVITDNHIKKLAEIGHVHVNVSLDGYRPESHGRFRGDLNSFVKTIDSIKKLSDVNLLQGILVTPNKYAQLSEYKEICDFAREVRAAYVLMNPLSEMGRGIKSRIKYALTKEAMCEIRNITFPYYNQVNISYIRFPNDRYPLSSCMAGDIIYIFARGELAICPYLVFASRNPRSKHKSEEFIVGNLINDEDIRERLDNYRLGVRYELGKKQICMECEYESNCGRGCPAAIISSGQYIDGVDYEVCPKL